MRRRVDMFGEEFGLDIKAGWLYFEYVYKSSFVYLVTF
jgi:hypothetical protein